ncbi:ABC transporter substrate-binding protein [Dehalococcoidia bacterium]|nr:ABC transporter substrate-binding protein [Dehalococcoidia bacterium]
MAQLRVGHSPDADDAFMFFGFAQGAVKTEPYEIIHVVEDIESLNKRALEGELEVTAISAAAYPSMAKHYRILACGASVGRNYGPIIVTREAMVLEQLSGKHVAIPGENTTAYMLLRFYLPSVVPVLVPFDQIMDRVQDGSVDAGVVIHEGQITYNTHGLTKIADLGESWFNDTGLPIPLGLDVVHRCLGSAEALKIHQAFLASILYAREHESEASLYAQGFSRGLDLENSRRFVGMYVNEDTLHMGTEGRSALEALYQRGYAAGLISEVPLLDIVGMG